MRCCLYDRSDVRSSNYIANAAAEFQVQGLELDYTRLLCLRCEIGNTKSKQEQQKYMLNTYCILLTRTVHLTLFNAIIADGVPQKPEHNDIKWIAPSEIPNYEFCRADEEILAKICELCNVRKR